jgi:hypothetical protein
MILYNQADGVITPEAKLKKKEVKKCIKKSHATISIKIIW